MEKIYYEMKVCFPFWNHYGPQAGVTVFTGHREIVLNESFDTIDEFRGLLREFFTGKRAEGTTMGILVNAEDIASDSSLLGFVDGIANAFVSERDKAGHLPE